MSSLAMATAHRCERRVIFMREVSVKVSVTGAESIEKLWRVRANILLIYGDFR